MNLPVEVSDSEKSEMAEREGLEPPDGFTHRGQQADHCLTNGDLSACEARSARTCLEVSRNKCFLELLQLLMLRSRRLTTLPKSSMPVGIPPAVRRRAEQAEQKCCP